MSENASLKLDADTTGLARGVAALRQVETAAGQAEKAATANAAATTRAGGAMSRLSNVSREARNNIRNASYQLSDMAVQAQMGTSWFTILGQQLPQLLGPLGMVGAALGILAAVGFPLVGAAIRAMGGDTKTAAESLDAFADSSGEALSAANAARQPVADLAKEYGSLAGEAKRALEAQAEFARAQSLKDMTDAVRAVTVGFGSLEGPARSVTQQVNMLAKDLGSTAQQARAVMAAAQDLRNADGPLEVARQAGILRDALIAAGVDGADPLIGQLNQAEQAGIDLGASANGVANNLAVAANNAAALTSNLGGAMSALAGIGKDIAEQNRQIQIQIGAVKSGTDLRIAAARAEADAARSIGVSSPETMQFAIRQYANTTAEIDKMEAGLKELKVAQDAVNTSVSKGGGGGGGGVSKAMKGAANEAKRLKDETASAAKEAEKLRETTDGVVDGLIDALVSGGNPFDVLESHFKDTLSKMVKAAMKAQLAKTASGGVGGLGGALGGGGGLGSLLMGAAGGPLGLGLAVLGGIFAFGRKKREQEQKRAEQKAALEVQLLEAQGNSVAALARQRSFELSKIDASNRDLQKKVWAEQDAAKRKQEADNLQIQLLQAQGKGSEALSLQRSIELKAIDASNRALQEKVWAEQDAAYRKNEADNLQIQLLQAQGKGLEALALQRSMELKAIDPSNRALQERVWALQDEAKILTERTSLQVRLLQLQGKDAEALALQRTEELKALDPSNHALQQRIWALEDEAKAVDAATAKIRELTDSVSEDKFANAFDYRLALAQASVGIAPATGSLSQMQTGAAASMGNALSAVSIEAQYKTMAMILAQIAINTAKTADASGALLDETLLAGAA